VPLSPFSLTLHFQHRYARLGTKLWDKVNRQVIYSESYEKNDLFARVPLRVGSFGGNVESVRVNSEKRRDRSISDDSFFVEGEGEKVEKDGKKKKREPQNSSDKIEHTTTEKKRQKSPRKESRAAGSGLKGHKKPHDMASNAMALNLAKKKAKSIRSSKIHSKE